MKSNLQSKLQLLSLPPEIIEHTNRMISKANFNSKIKFLENDLIFWYPLTNVRMHDLEIDYNWLLEATIQDFIDYPHPYRNMKIPLFRRTVRYRIPGRICGFYDQLEYPRTAPIHIVNTDD